jgi:hypothetical protein
MPWRGPDPDTPNEIPTLGNVVAEWIQQYCVIPDREFRGGQFVLTTEQHWHLIYHYALDESGKWRYPRGSQLVRPQKWGKGPFGAAMVCAEAAGPVLFAGWDTDGEPVGKPWATPHIQITACSEEQTDNTWRALQPMIELGDLGREFIPDTGLTRINLPGGGLIEPVTASARSRLGQRVTFVVQDQTESWLKSNRGHQLADNQRRGLAGMGGRFLETCNAPDPVEDSVASRTPKGAAGVYINDVDGGPGSVRNKQERRKVLRRVYGDSATAQGGWVDLDRIDAEIEALLEHDAGQAERFFLNRKVAAEGAAFNPEAWKALAKRRTVTAGAVIVLGVDGARHDDAIAVVATDVKSGYQWLVDCIERPDHAPDDYEHDLDRIDGAVSDLVDNGRYVVWRIYADDQYISGLIEKWQNKFGIKRVVAWHTNRPRPIAWAVRRFQEAISNGDLSHDGSSVYARHIRNSRKRMLTVLDDQQRQMHTLTKTHVKSPLKIDCAMAGVLSWEARYNAMQDGAVSLTEGPETPEPKPPDVYHADHAPALTGAGVRSTGWDEMA